MYKAGYGKNIEKWRWKKVLDAKEWLDVFPALDNKMRFNMLIFLCEKGSQSFSDIEKAFSLPPASTQHHLGKLMEARLIINSYKVPSGEAKEYSFYEPTERGKEILGILLKEQKT